MTLRPWILALLLFVAGAVGGAVVAGVQMARPSGSTGDVRGYLLAHPEVIPEAMQKLQEREGAKAVAANRSAIMDSFPGAVGGNPKGAVTVAVYMDYACGYCRASLPEIERLVSDHADVRIVYHELPILSPQSRKAAEWALAAAEQGKYLPFHNALFAAGRLTEATIQQAAQAAGLDVARAQRAIATPAVAGEIDRNLRTAGTLGMTGTPSWVVGDRVVSGAISQEQLVEAVKAARNKS